MTNAHQKDPRKNFVPRLLPWLLAILMLGVYWSSLNRWASLFNLDSVARVSGWIWEPDVVNPVTFLLTWPLRWLPAAQVPLALNAFSALFAALILALLARSVAILPQDRTEAQRLRENSDFSFLTIRSNWLPPVLAVLACGLQFTFWEAATNFTGDLINLLIFAFVVWSLLEYRLDEREGRLLLAAAVYGAGMTQDYGLIGFFPFLLAALIWICGLRFFHASFLLRLAGCGLAGLSLYLLLPTLAALSGKVAEHVWWMALKLNLGLQWGMVKNFFLNAEFRHAMALISLTSLLPVLMLSIRWKAAFGDRSRIGTEITGFMLNVVYAVLLGICLWEMFDPPFSAHHQGFGLPCLSFYYLAALSVGYYSGYFLLVSRVMVPRHSRRPPPLLLRSLQPAALALIAILTVLVAAGLVWKNGSTLRSINSGILKQYATLVADSLPRTGGIMLADNETAASDIPRRLFFVQEALVQAGRGSEYLPVDTYSLRFPDYQRYLHQKFPRQWPLVVNKNATNFLDPRGLVGLLQLLSKTNQLYYLNPSFGYYFEVFYQEAHGMVYQLKPIPEDTLQPPLPDARLQAENEAFWSRAQAAFPPIIAEETPRDMFASRHELGQRLMARLHITPEPNYNAKLAGQYYSRCLNFWGVQAQRAHALEPAAAHFETAQKLNPDNVVAGVNLGFNQDLRAGRPVVLNLDKTDIDQWGQYRSWEEIVTANGPFDEPSFCFVDGSIFLQASLLCQAIAAYERVRQFLPDNLPTLVSLGELYVFSHRPALALDALREPLAHPERFGLNETNSTEVNIEASAAYMQQTNRALGIRLLEREIDHHPDNSDLLTAAAQLYISQGLLTNALRVIQLKLALTPDDPVWLFGQGNTRLRLKQYPEAIASLTRVLNLQPENDDARFYRAVASLNTGDLPSARGDYQLLQQSHPNSFQVAYGLGEIAWRQHDTNGAVQNYSVYLANAPTNSAEFQLIRQRLAGLTGKSP